MVRTGPDKSVCPGISVQSADSFNWTNRFKLTRDTVRESAKGATVFDISLKLSNQLKLKSVHGNLNSKNEFVHCFTVRLTPFTDYPHEFSRKRDLKIFFQEVQNFLWSEPLFIVDDGFSDVGDIFMFAALWCPQLLTIYVGSEIQLLVTFQCTKSGNENSETVTNINNHQ